MVGFSVGKANNILFILLPFWIFPADLLPPFLLSYTVIRVHSLWHLWLAGWWSLIFLDGRLFTHTGWHVGAFAKKKSILSKQHEKQHTEHAQTDTHLCMLCSGVRTHTALNLVPVCVCRLRYNCGDMLLMTIIPLLQPSQLTVPL